MIVLACLLISWAGLWYHEIIRVPSSSGITVEGTVLMLAAAVIVYAVWVRHPERERGRQLLLGYGVISLVGGFLSAPPWAVFSLDTAHAQAHYISHLVYAVGQLPLIWYTLKRMPKVAA